LFAAVSTLSLLLCISISILWLRSYWVEDNVFTQYHWSYFSLASFCGEIGCEFGRSYDGGPADLYSGHLATRYFPRLVGLVPPSDYIQIAEASGRFANMPHYHDVMGFRWHPRMNYSWEYKERGIAVPSWFILMIFSILPARFFLAYRRRRPNGDEGQHCQYCGYDLRATPHRCPECGTAVARKTE